MSAAPSKGAHTSKPKSAAPAARDNKTGSAPNGEKRPYTAERKGPSTNGNGHAAADNKKPATSSSSRGTNQKERPQNGERKPYPRDNKVSERKAPETKPVEEKPAVAKKPAQPQIPLNPGIAGATFLDILRKKKEDEQNASAAAEAVKSTPALPETEKVTKKTAKKSVEKATEKPAPEPVKEEKKETKQPAAAPASSSEPPKKDDAAVLAPPSKRERKEPRTKTATSGTQDSAKPPAMKKEVEDIEEKLNKPDASKDPVVPTKSKTQPEEAIASTWAAPVPAPQPVADSPKIAAPTPAAEAPVRQTQAKTFTSAITPVNPTPQPLPVRTVAAAPVSAPVVPTVSNFNRQSEVVSLPAYITDICNKTTASNTTRKYRFHQPTNEISLPQQAVPERVVPTTSALPPGHHHHHQHHHHNHQLAPTPQAMAYQNTHHHSHVAAPLRPFNQSRPHQDWTRTNYGHEMSHRDNTYNRPRTQNPNNYNNGGYGANHNAFRPAPAPAANEPPVAFHPMVEAQRENAHTAASTQPIGAHRSLAPGGAQAPSHAGWGM